MESIVWDISANVFYLLIQLCDEKMIIG